MHKTLPAAGFHSNPLEGHTCYSELETDLFPTTSIATAKNPILENRT